MRRSLFALPALLVPLACSRPEIDDGRFGCSVDDDCPPRFTCHADNLCYRTSESSSDAGDAGDTSVSDGGSGCNPTGDYVEVNDATNDGVAESTGIELNATGQTIGGCIDPANAEAGRADEDRYIITQPSSSTLYFDTHFVRSVPDDHSTVVFELVDADLDVIPVATVTAGDARIVPFRLAQGVYTLRIRDTSPSAVSEPYTYSFRMHTVNCGSLPTTITYSENHDGADDRGNDVLSVQHTPPSTTTVSLTSSTSDTPEETTVSVVPGMTRRFNGSLAGSGTPTGDAYLDRDVFSVHTSAEAHAIVFQITTSTIGTVHALVTSETLAPQGTVLGFRNLDSTYDVAAIVPADGDVWLWLGNVDNALGYTMMACAIGD